LDKVKTTRVYSTEQGRICPHCDQSITHCQCSRARHSSTSAGDDILRLRRETKGRKGAGVSIVEGFDLSSDELKKLAKQLKQHCGCGGAIKQGAIEIQGEQRDRLQQWLEKAGYKVRRVGG